jgi:hypothetical protein
LGLSLKYKINPTFDTFCVTVKGKENDKISKADPRQEKGDNAPKDNATKNNATKSNAKKDNARKNNATKDNASKDNATKDNASKDDAKKSNDEKSVAKKSSGKDKSSVAKGKAKPIATKGGKGESHDQADNVNHLYY